MSTVLFAESATQVDSITHQTSISGKIFVKSGTIISNSDELIGGEIVVIKDVVKKEKPNLRPKNKNEKGQIPKVISKESKEIAQKPILVYRPAPSPFEIFSGKYDRPASVITNNNHIQKKKTDSYWVFISIFDFIYILEISEHKYSYHRINSSGLFIYTNRTRPPPFIV